MKSEQDRYKELVTRNKNLLDQYNKRNSTVISDGRGGGDYSPKQTLTTPMKSINSERNIKHVKPMKLKPEF